MITTETETHEGERKGKGEFFKQKRKSITVSAEEDTEPNAM